MVNRLIASILPWLPKKFVWLFSQRYIAGETIDDAVEVAKSLNRDGISVTVDHLGEYITDVRQAEEVRNVYFSVIDRFEREKLSSSFSLKPSGLGLLIDSEICFGYVCEIVERAKSYNMLVRIDMEDSRCVDAEIELFRRVHGLYPFNVGLVIQAYLKRTPADAEYLAGLHSDQTPINLRLCKGIYIESEEISIKDRREVNHQFMEVLEFLFRKGVYVGIATHDRFLTDEAQKLITKHALSDQYYEFQMLYGVTPELRSELVAAGHKMRVYVPFGSEWFGYSTRRLKENPKMAYYILKALVKRG